jgi:choline monooxygenase
LDLRRFGLSEFNGLLFEQPKRGPARDPQAELAKLAEVAGADFSGYQYHSHKLHWCDYNWKTFIEVYLEDYHVGPAHPGLGNFVTCDDLSWHFGDHHSVQTVGVHRALANPGSQPTGSPIYQRWHEAVTAYSGGQAPKFGAIWLTYYPTTMVEWYPHVMVVSSLHPVGPQRTLNLVEFFYPEEITAFEPDFIAAQQAAYAETAAEDDEIALRMDAGRKALWQRGDNEQGPYQSPMEDGMQHFHEWYGKALAKN